MSILAALEKMDKMFETRGSKPQRTEHYSSMTHAHQVCKDGIAASNGNPLKAGFCAGFVLGRMVGLGVFDAQSLNKLAEELASIYDG